MAGGPGANTVQTLASFPLLMLVGPSQLVANKERPNTYVCSGYSKCKSVILYQFCARIRPKSTRGPQPHKQWVSSAEDAILKLLVALSIAYVSLASTPQRSCYIGVGSVGHKQRKWRQGCVLFGHGVVTAEGPSVNQPNLKISWKCRVKRHLRPARERWRSKAATSPTPSAGAVPLPNSSIRRSDLGVLLRTM